MGGRPGRGATGLRPAPSGFSGSYRRQPGRTDVRREKLGWNSMTSSFKALTSKAVIISALAMILLSLLGGRINACDGEAMPALECFEPYNQELLDMPVSVSEPGGGVKNTGISLFIVQEMFRERGSPTYSSSVSFEFKSERELVLTVQSNDMLTKIETEIVMFFRLERGTAVCRKMTFNGREASNEDIDFIITDMAGRFDRNVGFIRSDNPLSLALVHPDFKYLFQDYLTSFNYTSVIYSILDLVQVAVDLYGADGYDLKVYHRYNLDRIEKNGLYIELFMRDKNKTGFEIKRANGTATSADDTVHFLYQCIVQPRPMCEDVIICDDAVVKIDGVTQDSGTIFQDNPIFREIWERKKDGYMWNEVG
jgi:hypothetical protein